MKLIRSLTTLFVVVLFLATGKTRLAFSQAVIDQRALDGFSVQGTVDERRWEEQFRAAPTAASAREHLRRLTLEPHVAGTKEDYATAVYVRDQFRSFGLPAELKEYQVWLNYPKTDTVVELVAGGKRVRLATREAVLPQDPTSANPGIC